MCVIITGYNILNVEMVFLLERNIGVFVDNNLSTLVKEIEYEKLTDEEHTEICNNLDCSKLSCHILVECIQNPRMSLKFIMRAILMEHLKTRRSLVATVTAAMRETEQTSLMEILQQDTTDCHTTHIENAMDSTYYRIQSLEKELRDMKNHIQHHHRFLNGNKNSNALNQERSMSFHFEPPEDSKIRRGGRGSISSSSFFLDNITAKQHNKVEMFHTNKTSSNKTKSFPYKFISSFKNVFGCRNQQQNKRS